MHYFLNAKMTNARNIGLAQFYFEVSKRLEIRKGLWDDKKNEFFFQLESFLAKIDALKIIIRYCERFVMLV